MCNNNHMGLAHPLLPAAVPDTRKPWSQALAIFCAAAVSNTIYLCFSSISEETAVWLGVSTEKVNSLVALSNAGTGLGYPLASYTLDRAGITVSFALGTTLAALGATLRLLGMADTSWRFTAVAVGVFIVNVGSGFLNALPAPLAVRRFSPSRQGVATGIGNLGVLVGWYGGPIMGMAFKEQPGQLLLVQAIAAIIVFPSFMLTYTGSGSRCHGTNPASMTRVDQSTAGDRPREEGILSSIRNVLRIPGMWQLAVAFFTCNSVFGVFCGLLEQMAHALSGAWPCLNQLLAVILVPGAIFGSMFSGVAADMFGTQRALQAASTAAALGWIACLSGWLFASSALGVVGWAFVVTCNGGAIPTLSFLAAARAAPMREGTVSALLHFCSTILAMLMQLFSEHFVQLPAGRGSAAQLLLAGWTLMALLSAALFRQALVNLPAPAESGSSAAVADKAPAVAASEGTLAAYGHAAGGA